MTRPITPPRQEINRTTIQPRPQSVAFSYLLTHETICPGLTKVNKPSANGLLSIHCKDVILLTVKPGNGTVNKKGDEMQLTVTKIIKAVQPGSTVARMYNQGYIQGISCNMPPVSFSLLRFFWRGNKRSDSLRQMKRHNERDKRNEEKLRSAAESPMLTRDCFILRSDGKGNERDKRNERKLGSEVPVKCDRSVNRDSADKFYFVFPGIKTEHLSRQGGENHITSQKLLICNLFKALHFFLLLPTVIL